MRRLRIAMLTYSLRPRGGVVHALKVSEALARRGHEVELIALGPSGESFFRDPTPPRRGSSATRRSATHHSTSGSWRCSPLTADGLADPLARGRFDLIHSQDCLSANAALELRDAGVVPHVIRTVHHVDDFTSPSLVRVSEPLDPRPRCAALRRYALIARLGREYGVGAELVSNGVDMRRYRPPCRRVRATRRSRAVRAGRPLHCPHDWRDRAAQGVADPARRVRGAARARAGARPAARRRRRRHLVRLPPRGRPLPRPRRRACAEGRGARPRQPA